VTHCYSCFCIYPAINFNFSVKTCREPFGPVLLVTGRVYVLFHDLSNYYNNPIRQRFGIKPMFSSEVHQLEPVPYFANTQELQQQRQIKSSSSTYGVFVSDMYCGPDSTFFIYKNGRRILACGDNTNGKLALGHAKTNLTMNDSGPIQACKDTIVFPNFKTIIKQVACGKDHTVVLTSAGAVYGAGDNTHNQLNIGKQIKQVTQFVGMNINLGNRKIIKISCTDYCTIVQSIGASSNSTISVEYHLYGNYNYQYHHNLGCSSSIESVDPVVPAPTIITVNSTSIPMMNKYTLNTTSIYGVSYIIESQGGKFYCFNRSSNAVGSSNLAYEDVCQAAGSMREPNSIIGNTYTNNSNEGPKVSACIQVPFNVTQVGAISHTVYVFLVRNNKTVFERMVTLYHYNKHSANNNESTAAEVTAWNNSYMAKMDEKLSNVTLQFAW